MLWAAIASLVIGALLYNSGKKEHSSLLKVVGVIILIIGIIVLLIDLVALLFGLGYLGFLATLLMEKIS